MSCGVSMLKMVHTFWDCHVSAVTDVPLSFSYCWCLWRWKIILWGWELDPSSPGWCLPFSSPKSLCFFLSHLYFTQFFVFQQNYLFPWRLCVEISSSDFNPGLAHDCPKLINWPTLIPKVSKGNEHIYAFVNS